MLNICGSDLFYCLFISRLGLLADDTHVDKRSNPLDTLSAYLAKRLAFASNERDIVILHHQVGVTWPSAANEGQLKTIDMVVYGDSKHSAMAKTVGLPAAIATQMILQSRFTMNV
jgi:alpha-aminoadipic semialdehyde synthase